MTTIHYTPPPDDAPEWVLAWCPELPDRWFSLSSSRVRRYWGKPWTAWCEQPPLPEPEPEPIPLEVGMRLLNERPKGNDWPVLVVLAFAVDGRVVVQGTTRPAGHRCDGDVYLLDDLTGLTTNDGRPVCLPDEPAPAAPPFDVAGWVHDVWEDGEFMGGRDLAEEFHDALVEAADDLPAPAEAAPPFDLAGWVEEFKPALNSSGHDYVRGMNAMWEMLHAAARNLPAPAGAYTLEQIERAMRPYYHDKHIEWVLAALRDGEGE